ncbi:MAG: hypothetical protein LBG44_08560, partial [Gemmatimonadota bacterium]|nr:hypothetical protein [Gemmatimonadota bacterium]
MNRRKWSGAFVGAVAITFVGCGGQAEMNRLAPAPEVGSSVLSAPSGGVQGPVASAPGGVLVDSSVSGRIGPPLPRAESDPPSRERWNSPFTVVTAGSVKAADARPLVVLAVDDRIRGGLAEQTAIGETIRSGGRVSAGARTPEPPASGAADGTARTSTPAGARVALPQDGADTDDAGIDAAVLAALNADVRVMRSIDADARTPDADAEVVNPRPADIGAADIRTGNTGAVTGAAGAVAVNLSAADTRAAQAERGTDAASGTGAGPARSADMDEVSSELLSRVASATAERSPESGGSSSGAGSSDGGFLPPGATRAADGSVALKGDPLEESDLHIH